MPLRSLWLFVLTSPILVFPFPAQATDSWVGRQVIPTTKKPLEIRRGDAVIGKTNLFQYLVTADDGEHIELSGHPGGRVLTNISEIMDMVTCDLFEVKLNAVGVGSAIVNYDVYSDLPNGTQVILACHRTYLDGRGQLSLWVGHNERLTMVPSTHNSFCGCHGSIDVLASDKKAFELFEQINASDSPGISTPVSDVLTIVFTVSGRQRLREFGRSNANLAGKLVFDNGGINVVEVGRQVLLPVVAACRPDISM